MSSRSAWNAISCARRGLVHRPAVEQLGDRRAQPVPLPDQPLRRARRDDAGRALQQIEPVPQLGRERLAFARPHRPALRGRLRHDRLDLAQGTSIAPSLAAESTSGCRATSSSVTSPAEPSADCSSRSRPATSRARSRSTASAACALRILGPAGLHRDVAAIEVAPQPLPQLALEPASSPGSLAREIEVPVVDGPDLDPQPSAGRRALRCAEPRHAVRHSTSA